jgi:hypothetical protein
MVTNGTPNDTDRPDSSGSTSRKPPVTERTPGSKTPANGRRGKTEPFVASPLDGPGTASEPRGLDGWTAPSRWDCPRPVLMELKGVQPGAVFRIHPPSALIGRSHGAEVELRDTTVSLEHARLTVREGDVQVEDLSSRNGTFVNEHRVLGPTTLTDGDYLSLGGFTLLKFSVMAELPPSCGSRS